MDESFEYDKENLTRKMTLSEDKKLFDGINCEKSFYLFSKRSWLRKWLYRIYTHKRFETAIMILIILSSIKLVLDTYMFDLPPESTLIIISDDLDYFFTAAFALETLIKAVSMGLFFDTGSYLRETWNQLDFIIVVVSIVDSSFVDIDLPVIKILRLLRTLRPLRMISHNSGMKTIVVALVQSVGGILNVAIVVMIVWMMFAILAVNLFGGKLRYCTVDPFINHTKESCFKNRG